MFANIGWKTIAVAVVMVILAALSIIGIDITSITMLTPGELLLAAASLLGLRFGIAKAIPPSNP